jgi:hypothetical protein
MPKRFGQIQGGLSRFWEQALIGHIMQGKNSGGPMGFQGQ